MIMHKDAYNNPIGVRTGVINRFRLSHTGGASGHRCRTSPVVLNLALTAADRLLRKSSTPPLLAHPSPPYVVKKGGCLEGVTRGEGGEGGRQRCDYYAERVFFFLRFCNTIFPLENH